MDGEMRVGILIVHGHLCVEVDPAHGIDKLCQNLRIENHIVVKRDAQEIAHRTHRLHRPSHAIYAADRLRGSIRRRHQRPPRNGQHPHPPRALIEADQENAVRIWRTVFLSFIHPEEEDVHVVVKLRIHRRLTTGLAGDIRLVHAIVMMVDFPAPKKDTIAAPANAAQKGEEEQQPKEL